MAGKGKKRRLVGIITQNHGRRVKCTLHFPFIGVFDWHVHLESWNVLLTLGALPSHIEIASLSLPT